MQLDAFRWPASYRPRFWPKVIWLSSFVIVKGLWGYWRFRK